MNLSGCTNTTKNESELDAVFSTTDSIAMQDKLSPLRRTERRGFVAIAVGLVSLSVYEQWHASNDYYELLRSTADAIQWNPCGTSANTTSEQLQQGTNITGDGGSNEAQKAHPHAGARFPDGTWGYVADVTAVRKSIFEKSRADGVVPSRSYMPLSPEEKQSICGTPPGKGFEGNGGWEILKSQIQLEGPTPSEDDDNNRSNKTLTQPASRGRIMCVVYTHGGDHQRLVGIRDTWAWRCDGFFAASTITGNDPDDERNFGAVDLPHEGPEEYDNMWQKTRSIIGYLYDNYLQDYDYFFLSGDDTLLIVENLRFYLGWLEAKQGFSDTFKPLYTGHPIFAPGNRFTFAGGGSGYLVNRVALQKLVQELDQCLVHAKQSSEDRFVGKCLKQAGVPLTNAIDPTGRDYFHGLDPEGIARDKGRRRDMEVIKTLQQGDYRHGADGVSSRSVSLHILKTSERMKRMHAILYRSCPKGSAVGDALSNA